MDRIHPRIQVAIGGAIYSGATYFSQFAPNFEIFLMIYSVVAGIGFGLIYNVPLKCAWSYFPNHRTLVAGIILCCYSLNAIVACTLTT